MIVFLIDYYVVNLIVDCVCYASGWVCSLLRPCCYMLSRVIEAGISYEFPLISLCCHVFISASVASSPPCKCLFLERRFNLAFLAIFNKSLN